MTENLVKKVKLLCQTYNLKPAHSRGQNFLIDLPVLNRIVDAAELKKDDLVLEVGPGLGILTEALVDKVKKVIAVELDRDYFNFLWQKFKQQKNLTLVSQDILRFDPKKYGLIGQNYKVVANLPYNITSIFLKTFLTAKDRPAEMTLLLQKEVAQRICAPKGELSLLALSVQLYGNPKIIGFVDKTSFWPMPEVNSAIIKISDIKDQKAVDNFLSDTTDDNFWKIAKISYSSKRKQLHNNLSSGLKLRPEIVEKMLSLAKIDPKTRAQDLSIEDLIRLAKSWVLCRE